MVSAVLNSLSLIFVVAGITLLITSIGLSRQARRYRKGMQKLLQLASQNLEPLEIPALAWPVLVESGWRHLVLTGKWFGYPLQISLGNETIVFHDLNTSNVLEFDVSSGEDVQLTLRLHHRIYRGEGWLFAEQLSRVFVLLIETSLRTRTEAMSLAMAERARLSLYLQHDMRNMAQWVGWVCADFATYSEPQDLLTAARRLQKNAPLAQERAQRLIASLRQKPVLDHPGVVDLRLAIINASHLAGIDVHISGQAQAWIAGSLLARVLDNLFSNLAPNWREHQTVRPTLRLQTTPRTAKTEMAEIHFFSPWPDAGAQIAPEKLFEPFASERAGGLGLGLYQARKSLHEAGGELQATPTPEGLGFFLQIPTQAP
jgi:hypothetical protein